MSYAFMGRILRVNLSEGRVDQEDIPESWAKKYLGGAGLATRYLFEMIPGGVDPLGPLNPLIFMTGPLTGTPSASASRYSVVSKSPLTGLWGQSNSGGSFGPALKRSGYDGIIFEGVLKIRCILRLWMVKPHCMKRTIFGGRLFLRPKIFYRREQGRNGRLRRLARGVRTLFDTHQS